VDGDGDAVEAGHHRREAWASRVVSIFIPPAIFEEMQAVFDFPVAANQLQKIRRRHGAGVEAGDEIADMHVLRPQQRLSYRRSFQVSSK